MTTTQQCILHYGSVHCAENIADVSEATRQRIKQAIMEDIEFRMRGFRVPYALETKLFDNFAHLNRDWRRIALTEVSEIENQGLIASLEPGRKVKRVGKDCACEFCQSIDGKIMEVVAADDPDKDGERHVWAGKTNIGRSACHYRKCREVLIERAPHERWWVATGVQHPNCRGTWIVLDQPKRSADPEFSRWMDEYLGRA